MDSDPGFALVTLRLDLGISPMDCYVDIFRYGKIVERENIEIGAFNDLCDLMDLVRHRIAQRYIWHELWR
jgi:hypothetical protein